MTSSVHSVATLISGRERPALDDAIVAQAASALETIGATALASNILDPGVAVDLLFDIGEDVALVRVADAVRQALQPAQVDVIVQPAASRRKKLLLADMDSTMIEQECIDELADFVGLREHVATITERAMRGEIAFEPALRERVALLRNLEESVVPTVIADRISLTPGAQDLVRVMRAHGAYTALVSGGFTVFTNRVAKTIGFDEDRANVLLAAEGRFIGQVAEPILGQAAKLEALRELRLRLGLDQADTLAVGDGANDLAMLGEAGLGVAYRAKPAVAAAAHARVEFADLRALLYAQGYQRADLQG